MPAACDPQEHTSHLMCSYSEDPLVPITGSMRKTALHKPLLEDDGPALMRNALPVGINMPTWVWLLRPQPAHSVGRRLSTAQRGRQEDPLQRHEPPGLPASQAPSLGVGILVYSSPRQGSFDLGGTPEVLPLGTQGNALCPREKAAK